MKIDMDSYRAGVERIQGKSATIGKAVERLDFTVRDPRAARFIRSVLVLAMPAIVVILVLIALIVGLHFW
ncbi:MAG: hypothetical protein Q4A52_02830 [Bacillota bacterium]|nr:hypothetical protein [Bacillota bacterium]